MQGLENCCLTGLDTAANWCPLTAFDARAPGPQVLRDAAARPAVRALRAEALRELGRLFVEAAAMHCEVAAANGASAQARCQPPVTGRRCAPSGPGKRMHAQHGRLSGSTLWVPGGLSPAHADTVLLMLVTWVV
jgi:hypothetical protein